MILYRYVLLRKFDSKMSQKLLCNKLNLFFILISKYNFRPETSRILLKVNSNPRQLNATSMANLLESDASLREHARSDLGVEIDSFGAGDEVIISHFRLYCVCVCVYVCVCVCLCLCVFVHVCVCA